MPASVYAYRLTVADMDRMREAAEMIRAAGEVFAQLRSPYQPALLKLLGDAADRIELVNGKAIATVTRALIRRGRIPDPNAAERAQAAPRKKATQSTQEGARE